MYSIIAIIVIAILIMTQKPKTKWWEQSNLFEYSEGFEDKVDITNTPTNQSLVDYPPNTPSPVEFNNKPYYLLDSTETHSDTLSNAHSDTQSNAHSDALSNAQSDALSSTHSDVTSRSCYETDFESSIEKTGNFRQTTNNYKRKNPDNCSTLRHEFIGFYK